MAKVKIQGNASGTGVLTVTAPNTSTDRTITLPDSTDTLAVNSDVTNKLPLAGGTMTGTLSLQNNVSNSTSATLKLTGSSNVTQDNFILFGDNATSSPIAMGFDNSENTFKIARNANDDLNSNIYFKMSSSGVISAPIGVELGGGLNATAANTLDDYEEGTHTVTATCSGGGSITLSSTNNKFTYTKIGNLVTITGRLDVSAISSPSGDLYFSLPFAIAQIGSTNNTDTSGGMFVWYPVSGDSGKWVSWADAGTSIIYVRHGDGVQPPQSANLVRVSTEFRMNFSYRTT